MRTSPLHERLKAGESGWCLHANRLCARHGLRAGFAAVSRLGDGVFWYVLMAAMVLCDAHRGLKASLHLAATGAFALLLYKLLKRWTRRPRPFMSDVRIRAWVAPLMSSVSHPDTRCIRSLSPWWRWPITRRWHGC